MNDKLKTIRIISNRLLGALVALMCIGIPGTFYAFLNPGGMLGVTPLMTLLVGFIGGFVGLQRRLKQMSHDDLMLLADSWVYISLSPLVGGILAWLTYILFISGLLAGDLFPRFVPDTGKATEGFAALFAIHGEAADYAKLIFWCFLAGFSEKFAVNIISQFESRATNESEPKP